VWCNLVARELWELEAPFKSDTPDQGRAQVVELGIHAALRAPFQKDWEFESPLGHQGHLAQSVEAAVSKAARSEFESRGGYQQIGATMTLHDKVRNLMREHSVRKVVEAVVAVMSAADSELLNEAAYKIGNRVDNTYIEDATIDEIESRSDDDQ
jgi:hypothetical protein